MALGANSSGEDTPVRQNEEFTMTLTQARFAGRTVVITGAGSGIGRATAVLMGSEGARVIATDIREDRLKELADEYPGITLIPVVGDITHPDVIAEVITACDGKLDVLVNNAGIMDGFLSVAEVDDATWREVFAVNVDAPMRLTRAAIPLMKAAGRGAIVNVASEASLRGSAAGAAYTASKHAVIGLTRSTALLHAADGIRTNAVAPGAVRTNIEAPMKSLLYAERLGKHLQNIPRFASSEELAAGIAFLASDDAANFNGAVIACDGGWSAI